MLPSDWLTVSLWDFPTVLPWDFLTVSPRDFPTVSPWDFLTVLPRDFPTVLPWDFLTVLPQDFPTVLPWDFLTVLSQAFRKGKRTHPVQWPSWALQKPPVRRSPPGMRYLREPVWHPGIATHPAKSPHPVSAFPPEQPSLPEILPGLAAASLPESRMAAKDPSPPERPPGRMCLAADPPRPPDRNRSGCFRFLPHPGHYPTDSNDPPRLPSYQAVPVPILAVWA